MEVLGVLRCHEAKARVRDEDKRGTGPQSWCHSVGREEANRHSCLRLLWESHIAKRTVLNSEKETDRVGEEAKVNEQLGTL